LCVVVKTVVWSVVPSSNVHNQTTPVAVELTLKVKGTPVVPVLETFKNTLGGGGVGVGGGPPGGVGVGCVGGVTGAVTVARALSVPTLAVTCASAEALSVLVARPFDSVAADVGDSDPASDANCTITPSSGAPWAFCT
jgi:hypothetical protein